MRFMEIANPEDQLALWRLISDNVWSAVMAQAKQATAQKAQAAANPKPKKFKPKKAIPKPPPAPKPKPPTPKPPPAKSLYPHSKDRWPPAGLHHYPAHSLCSGLPIQVVLARLICMACSSRLRVQGKPIRHKNPSNGSKPWIYDEKYCVFKFHGRGDDRHSKNGSSSRVVKLARFTRGSAGVAHASHVTQ
jgi:hypothetical protein